MAENFFLYDDMVDTRTRFLSFMGENERHDLALLHSNTHYGKTIVLDMQRNRFAIIGQDDLKEPGYIAHAFDVTEEIAEELKGFLEQVI